MPDTSNADIVKKFIADLEALPSRARLDDDDTEIIYAEAYQLVQQGNFEKAVSLFSMISIYRPTTIKYLAGLAICEKKLGRPESAAGIYAFMALIETEQPLHHLCIAECLLQQGKKQEARESLALVVQFCEANSGHEKTLARARAIDALLAHANAA
ncbi:CesD/SycD/LcrH family type III secretion system chaperone [Comamonas endophytica]